MKRVRDLRVWITVVTLAVLAAGTVGVLGAIFGGWKLGLATDDQAVVINTALAAVSCALVALAGIVALVAYLAASGRPNLDLEIIFNFSFPNEPVFVADDPDDNSAGWLPISPYKQVEATVLVKNASSYAAKNPGVRIELEGLAGLSAQDGWETLTFATTVGIIAIQWDGGADSIIHGQWSRTLPSLDFSGVQGLRSDGVAALTVTIAADGVPPVSRTLPVRILTPGEYEAYTKERAVRLGI